MLSLTSPPRRPFLQAPEVLSFAMICLGPFLPGSWLFFFMSHFEVVEVVKTTWVGLFLSFWLQEIDQQFSSTQSLKHTLDSWAPSLCSLQPSPTLFNVRPPPGCSSTVKSSHGLLSSEPVFVPSLLHMAPTTFQASLLTEGSV